jgi:conjugal transfer/type IV secretion protein DotA/TraY
MTPDRTFVGSQSQGYLLLLSLFARPALAVVGLFAAMLVSDPIIDFIARLLCHARCSGDIDWDGRRNRVIPSCLVVHGVR